MAKTADTQPVGFIDGKGDEDVVNDSLGSVALADSSGNDKEKECEDRRPSYETNEKRK